MVEKCSLSNFKNLEDLEFNRSFEECQESYTIINYLDLFYNKANFKVVILLMVLCFIVSFQIIQYVSHHYFAKAI